MADEPATKADIQSLRDDLRAEIQDLRDTMERRFEYMDSRFNQVMDLFEAMATGHSKRFDALERKIDGRPPLTLVP